MSFILTDVSFTVTVKPEEYLKNVKEHSMYRLMAVVSEKTSRKVAISDDTFCFVNPQVIVKVCIYEIQKPLRAFHAHNEHFFKCFGIVLLSNKGAAI